MKQLTCEMCGSTDLVKQDGVFVCQTCGCKYSVEEARKMMIEGTVEVQGSVKIDSSEEIKKLYQAARNARETSDSETAIKHYERISALDPNSWESAFYCVVLKTDSIKNGEIGSAAVRISNSIPTVIQLIKNYVSDEEEQKKALKEVAEQCFSYANWLVNASYNFYKSLNKGNGARALTGIYGAISSFSSYADHLDEHRQRCEKIVSVMYTCGSYIERMFDMSNADFCSYAVYCYKMGVRLCKEYQDEHGSKLLEEKTAEVKSKLLRLTSDPNNTGVAILELSREGGPNDVEVVLSNGKAFYLDSGKKIKLEIKPGIYSLDLNFKGKLFVSKQKKSISELRIKGNTQIIMTYDALFGGFNFEIIG